MGKLAELKAKEAIKAVYQENPLKILKAIKRIKHALPSEEYEEWKDHLLQTKDRKFKRFLEENQELIFKYKSKLIL